MPDIPKKKKCASCYRPLPIESFPNGRKKCEECRKSSHFHLEVQYEFNREFSAMMLRWDIVPGSKPYRW